MHMYTSHQISLCITLVFILCLSKIWKSRTFLKSVEHLRLILFLTFNKSSLIQTPVHHISPNCVMADSLICAIVNFFKLQPDFLKSNLRISARVNQAQDVVYIMWHGHVTRIWPMLRYDILANDRSKSYHRKKWWGNTIEY